MYRDLRAIARSFFANQPPGHTLQPTALVNEAFLRLWRGNGAEDNGKWRSRGQFLAVAATAMRHILVDYARSQAALKRGGGMAAGVRIDASSLAAPPAADVVEVGDAIDRLAVLDDRAARVVTLRFFAGLTIAQVAEILGVSDFTVENDWRIARAFLARELSPVPNAQGGPA